MTEINKYAKLLKRYQCQISTMCENTVCIAVLAFKTTESMSTEHIFSGQIIQSLWPSIKLDTKLRIEQDHNDAIVET